MPPAARLYDELWMVFALGLDEVVKVEWPRTPDRLQGV